MAYYVLFIIVGPIAVYLLGDFVSNYWAAKQGSSTARTIISWNLPKEQILLSPIFGFGYGTSKPLFIFTQIPHAIGLGGTVLFVYFTARQLRDNSPALTYLLCVVIYGMGNFELGLSELWIYFGLLLNPYINPRTSRVPKISGTSPPQFSKKGERAR